MQKLINFFKINFSKEFRIEPYCNLFKLITDLQESGLQKPCKDKVKGYFTFEDQPSHRQ